MADAGTVYILQSDNVYLMQDENTYLIDDSTPLPEGWLKNRAFPIQRTASGKSIQRRGKTKKLGNK